MPLLCVLGLTGGSLWASFAVGRVQGRGLFVQEATPPGMVGWAFLYEKGYPFPSVFRDILLKKGLNTSRQPRYIREGILCLEALWFSLCRTSHLAIVLAGGKHENVCTQREERRLRLFSQ